MCIKSRPDTKNTKTAAETPSSRRHGLQLVALSGGARVRNFYNGFWRIAQMFASSYLGLATVEEILKSALPLTFFDNLVSMARGSDGT